MQFVEGFAFRLKLRSPAKDDVMSKFSIVFTSSFSNELCNIVQSVSVINLQTNLILSPFP